MVNTSLRWTMRIAILLALWFEMWTLSLPLYVDLPLMAGLMLLVLRSSVGEAALLGVTVSGCLAMINGALFLFGESAPQYYREHEKYAQLGQIYQSYVDDTIHMPHGDLSAIDPLADPSIREPRVARFVTDSLGYRNERDYNHQQFVLVGDSFVVANGSDQQDTLSAILSADYGIDAYNLGFPSAPIDYERRAAWFLATISSNVRFLFFIYEGNDFTTRLNLPVFSSRQLVLPSSIVTYLDYYDLGRLRRVQSWRRWLKYPEMAFALSRRAEKLVFLRDVSTSVIVQNVDGKAMGFLESQNQATVDPHPSLVMDLHPEVLAHTACFLFIPTKLRVYASALPPEVQAKLAWPSPAYRALQATFGALGIPVLDLTEPLTAAAAKQLNEGKYVFWRDDTHWNGLGMRAAAPTIARCATEDPGHRAFDRTKIPLGFGRANRPSTPAE